MSSERVRHEIKRLVADSDALGERLQALSQGSRYVRTAEKTHELYTDLRRAHGSRSPGFTCFTNASLKRWEKCHDTQSRRSSGAGLSRPNP